MKTAAFASLLLVACSLGAIPLPPPLEIAHLVGKGSANGTPPVAPDDEFYALGWSRTNAFAVLERRKGSSATEVRFRVLDMVTDTTLWEKRWSDWGEPEAKATWWQGHQPEVEAVFARYELTPTDTQLGVFPAIIDNEYYTLALRSRRVSREWIDRLEIVLHSTGRGLKIVSDTLGYWRWAALLGFVPSPFENRVAVVLLVQPAGWEGVSQPVRYLVVGVSLKAGFAQP